MAQAQPTRKQRREQARAAREAAEREAARRARNRRRLWQVGGVVGVAIVVVAVLIAVSQKGNDKAAVKAGKTPPGAAQTNALFAGIPQSGIYLGSAKAPVTLVEFGDLQCPFCRQFADNVLPTIVARYVRPGRVRLQWRSMTFIGDDSTKAAQMAEAAGLQNRLWPFIDLFYRNQGQENTGYVTDSFLRGIGGGVRGLDVDRAMSDRGNLEVQQMLSAANAAAQQFGVSSTPSFLIGGRGRPLQPLNYSKITPDQFTGPLDRVLKQ
jgi:protein-disulfide isomerase